MTSNGQVKKTQQSVHDLIQTMKKSGLRCHCGWMGVVLDYCSPPLERESEMDGLSANYEPEYCPDCGKKLSPENFISLQ